MDPIYGEFAKAGVLALAFGIMLWRWIVANERMAQELKADKDRVVEAVIKNTAAFEEHSLASRDLANALKDRPCLAKKAGE